MAEDPTYHIRVNKDDIGNYVLMPGDRGRVERIAKYLDAPQEVGNNREYLSYTGNLNGEKVSVISSGMGGPAIAIAIEELKILGVHTIVRIGTAGALQKSLSLGDSIIATAAFRDDGVSKKYIDSAYPAVASYAVTSALSQGAQRIGNPTYLGIVLSTDAYYARDFAVQETRHLIDTLVRANVLCVEMECATLFTLGNIYRMRIGAILTSREEIDEDGSYIQAGSRYEDGLEKSIRAAVQAVRILIEAGEVINESAEQAY